MQTQAIHSSTMQLKALADQQLAAAIQQQRPAQVAAWARTVCYFEAQLLNLRRQLDQTGPGGPADDFTRQNVAEKDAQIRSNFQFIFLP